MPLYRPSPSCLASLRPAQRALCERFTTYAVEHAEDPLFDLAYEGLNEHFGAEGHIEAREVLARIVTEPFEFGGVRIAYPVLVMRDTDGTLVAVLSRYVSFEPAVGIAAALDGSGYIVEPYRRLGIGSLSMPLLLDAGCQRLGAFELSSPPILLDSGDLAPVREGDEESIGRAVVWGKNGCAVIPPSVFPLALVGMQDQDAPGEVAPPVPILAMLRSTDGSMRQPTQVSKRLLNTLARHLEAAHSWAGESAGLAAETHRLQAAIAAAPNDPVPLLPLPTSLQDHETLHALCTLVHPLDAPAPSPSGGP